uniref:Uncharacterized protein n=1 Tax=viral metagenome TaxID=1070528 RepID=A0A6M3JB38_9ZZZZ
MPTNLTKHEEEKEIVIDASEFSGGMNSAAAPEALEQQVPLIQNMYYNSSSGRLRTRHPFKRYSTAVVPGAEPITGIIHFDSEFHVMGQNSGTHTLYYLDANLAPQSIGAVNGTAYPSFVKYGGDLCFANGAAPEEVTTGRVLTDIANAPSDALCLIEKNQQLGVVGDSNNPDLYAESSVIDKDVWAGGTSEQYSLGYKDDNLEIVGCSHGPGGYVILWKYGRSGRSIWMLDPNAVSPVAHLISEDVGIPNHRCTARVLGRLWIMDEVQGPLMLEGVDATEKIVIDPQSWEIGQRILDSWTMNATHAFMCVYPPHSQIWFFPNPSVNNYIYVLHYRTGAWVRFKPASTLSFYSAYYHPADRYLYLGGSDGFIYRYTTDESAAYTDDPGGYPTSYPQKVYSKIYNLFPSHEHIIKGPIFNYRSLATGAGIIKALDDYGETLIFSDSFNIENPRKTLYEYRAKTLYEARAETLYKRSVVVKKNAQHFGADNLQFNFIIDSGAIEIHNIVLQVARGRKI